MHAAQGVCLALIFDSDKVVINLTIPRPYKLPCGTLRERGFKCRRCLQDYRLIRDLIFN